MSRRDAANRLAEITSPSMLLNVEFLPVTDWIELACRECDWHSQCGPSQMLTWLRSAGMVRRDAAPELELLPELLRSAVPRLACPKCQAVGLVATDADDESNDEAWGMTRKCAACGQAIPRERLEVFPKTDLCVRCQGQSDRGESGEPAEYCPRCGNVMIMRQARRGVTKYVMACPSCRS